MIAPAFGQNSAEPRTIPGLDTFSLPPSRPTPRVQPPPVQITTPAPTPSPTAQARATPVPRPTPTPARPPARIADRVASPTAAPPPLSHGPIPLPTPTISAAPPVPIPPQAEPAPFPASTARPAGPPLPISGVWPWIALAVLVVAGALTLLRSRRTPDASRRDDRQHESFAIGVAEEPAPPAPPVAPADVPADPPPPAAARAQLEIELQPRRAGTNLLSAAVEYRIVVRNTGAAVAAGVQLDVRLLSAGAGQDALIAALFAAPIERPLVDPFDLPPETMVELGGMAMHPRETLQVMEVDGKTLFVPVLTIDLGYDRGDGASGQTARSYVIGIDRGGDAKLQPFRLDGAPRMYDTVGALAYTIAADA